MKAIAIQQPWAQLVASGYKRLVKADSDYFAIGERVLIYASGNDPLADNDGELLPPMAKMQLENAKLLGYLTDDELPTGVILGSAEICDFNNDVQGDWKGVDEGDLRYEEYVALHDARIFYDPIKLDNVTGSRIFNVPSMKADSLPESFKLKKITRNGNILCLPCTYDFACDISDVKEYTYSLYVLYNNVYLLCNKENGELALKDIEFLRFSSPWTDEQYRVVESYLEPSTLAQNVYQAVFKIRVLDKRDLGILSQPLQMVAKAALKNGFPIVITPHHIGDYVVSNYVLEFSSMPEKPHYICFYHKEEKYVDVRFTASLLCRLTPSESNMIVSDFTSGHFPFNTTWDTRHLTMCGVIFTDNGMLYEDSTNEFFSRLKNSFISLMGKLQF